MDTTGTGLIDIPGQMLEFYAIVSGIEDGGGWREVGAKVGVSGAYARLIALRERPMTPVIAARWLGKVDFMVTTIRVPVCPLHGEPHVADCHGRAVAAVVALAPGERVVQDVSRETFARQPRTRPRYLRPCLSLDPAVRLRQLERLTCAALAEQGEQHV